MDTAGQPEALSLAAIDAFLIEEAHLLDSRQFEAWMALFTPDGFYWAPSTPDQDNPLDHVSLIYDDREAMETRIRRLRHPRIHSQNPHTRQTRVVGNVAIEEPDGGGNGCLVRSKFLLYEYRPSIPEAQERVLGGTYWHRLVQAGEGIGIASKKAVLANCDARLSPFFVYFRTGRELNAGTSAERRLTWRPTVPYVAAVPRVGGSQKRREIGGRSNSTRRIRCSGSSSSTRQPPGSRR